MDIARWMPTAAKDPTFISIQKTLGGEEDHLRIVRDPAQDTVMRQQILYPFWKMPLDLSQRPEFNLSPKAIADCAANEARA